MKYIKIKCKAINDLNTCKYHVIILNNKNIIFDGYTKETIYLNLKIGIYNIVIIPCNNKSNKICSTFIVDDNSCNTFNFVFYKKNPITIKITDKNYKGLPIEKGKIIIWQNNT